MQDIQIRPAISSDCLTIQALLHQLGYAITPESVSAKIELFTQKPGHYAFVAICNSRIAGFMSLHVMEWFHRSDCIARLSAIVIDHTIRGIGIGHALMNFAEEKARQEGCTMMEVSSSLNRKAEGTYDFYASLGYVDVYDQSTYFRKDLTIK